MKKDSFPYASALALVLVAAKMFDVIDWSWWLVLAPLWVAVLIMVVAMAAYVVLHIRR
jgi:hypothetical protein